MAEKNHPPPLTPVLQERASAELYELNKKLQKQLKQDVNRQVYNQNVIKHKEDAVLEQIRKARGRKRAGLQGTPDSDVFLTPKDSPSEAPYTYRGNTCNFPKPESSSIDRRKSSIYYNLVHLEEDFNSPSSGGSNSNLLEKELAEQDQLFQSFHSIIIKEGQEEKKKLEPAPTSTSVKKKKVAIVKPVKKVVKSKFFPKPIKNEYIDCGFDSEYLTLEGDYKRKGMNYGGKIEEGMSGRHQDSRGSPIGPSSGASSPSVTWDSVMQDPPLSHHYVMSPGDSPSASHPTTYYSSPEPPSKPLTSPSPPKSPGNSLQDKPISPKGKDKIITYDRAVSPVNFQEPDVSQITGILKLEESTRSSVADDSYPVASSLPVSPVFPSPPILRPEVSPPQTKTVACPTNLNSQPDSQILKQDLKTDTLCTVKTNYFIDASNLTDEAEGDLINNLSVAYITRSAIDFVEPKLVTKEVDAPTYSKELDNSLTLCNTIENSCDVSIINKDCQNNISINSDKIFDTPLKLVRHNTFEVEPTMISTHVLINNVNDLNTSSNFNHEYPKSEIIKCLNINNFQTCEVGVQNNQGMFMPLSESKHAQTDDDGHSPDSLINDNLKNECPGPTVVDKTGTMAVEDLIASELIVSSLSSKPAGEVEAKSIISESSIKLDPPHESELVVENKTLLSSVKGDDTVTNLELLKLQPSMSVEKINEGDKASSEHVVDSPRVRRKTDDAPILSGAATFSPEVEEKPLRPKGINSMTTSWTIDMSDSVASEHERRKSERVKSANSSFGFFVPLNNEPTSKGDVDILPKKISEHRKSINEDETANSSQGSSCGFYIDLKNDFESLDSQVSVQSGENDVSKPEKKLFSMFIDISDSCSKSSDSASPKSKTSSPFLPPRKARVKNSQVIRCEDPPTSLSSDSGLDMGAGEHPEVVRGKTLFSSSTNAATANTSTSSSSETSKKQSFYMFIEASDNNKSNRRKTMPPGFSQSATRLSWNSDSGQSLLDPGSNSKMIHTYKRAHSLNDKSNNTATEDNRLSGPASIDTVSTQKITPNGSSNRMMSSWHGVVKPSTELSKIIKNSKSKESSTSLRDMSNSISEKCDKEDISSSVKSDDVFDSNASVSSKDDNRTFILDDVSKIAQANTSELEASTTSSHDIISDLSKDDTETDKVQEESVSSNKTQKSGKYSFEADYPPNVLHNNEATLDTRHRINEDDDGYVKLSDMDRIMPNYSRDNRKNSRMTRSIPEGSSVFENKILTKSSTSRSLSRLFPHLSSQFQVEPDDLPSNASMQSSFNPSLEASAEGFVGECSRLGEDLLRMFLEEISPDVVVEVGGRRIKAHKCILSSRCQYFAAMLSGGWVESAGNVISLPGFSYNTVHFALCHIYSGASNVPESINIVELATLADMLCLEGLKEVITYTLKVKFCHFFHKPCSECIVGCVECLPVAAAYGLDEIYRKSLRWISKHFTRVWPTKSFASLPKELHDKCYKQHIVHMNAENILETIMGCEKLEATIPKVRWAETIFSLNVKLQDTSHKYLTNHFKEVLSSNAFLSLSREDTWTIGRLEDVLLTSTELLQPDQAVHSYGKLHAMVAAITPQSDFKMEFLNLLKKLECRVEECLIKQAGRAVRTAAWTKLDPTLRKKIQEAACLVFTPGDARRQGILNQQQRSLSRTELAGVSSSLERKRPLLTKTRPVSSKSVPPPNKTKLVPTQIKSAVVSTKSSSVVGCRLANSKIPSSSNISKTAPRASAPCQPPAVRQAKSQTTTSSSATPSPLLKSRNNRFAQVKSRYLDPKPERKDPTDSVGRESRTCTQRTGTSRTNRNVGSSSDSSRTASPACMRHPRAMSTDSLEAATQPAPSRVSSAPPPRLNKNSLTQQRPRIKPSVGPRSSTFTKPSAK